MPETYPINAYKIWYADAPEDIYVGSTRERLSRRMSSHRYDSRRGKPSKIHQVMREKGENNFQYCLLGTRLVRNMDQQRKYEQQWMKRLKPTLNMCRAYSTPGDRRKSQRIYKKKQRELLKDIPKYYCECCDKSLFLGVRHHCGTQKHKDNYKNKFREVFDMEITDAEVPKHL